MNVVTMLVSERENFQNDIGPHKIPRVLPKISTSQKEIKHFRVRKVK